MNPSMRDDSVPPALRDAIARDLRPVAPLPPPSARVLPLVPVGFLLLAGSVAVFGLRGDAGALGPWLTWLASSAQMGLGLVAMAAALREAVPGTTLARRAVGAIAGTAVLAVVFITWATWWTSPTTVPAEAAGFVWRVCVAGTLVAALPAMVIAGWLVARAFPLRPRLAGALYGLGAGLLADAGWRLFCHYSDPAHVLGAHTLAVGIAVMLGAGLSGVVHTRRLRHPRG